MKFIILTIFVCCAAHSSDYKAEVKETGSETLLYRIEMSESSEKEGLRVQAKTFSAQATVNETSIEETALLDKTTFEVIESQIINRQTGETSKITVGPDKIAMEYQEKGKALVKKELVKPDHFVVPANFENWIRFHFAELKKQNNMAIHFLIWERHEVLSFKVTYLGETDLNKESTQLFKMNIDNFLLAAFIQPIKIWYSGDMKQIRRYLGRVSVKKQESDKSFTDLDGDVKYLYPH